ncbi:MAG TPA: hypothetical protein VMA83_00730 [Solirubrobacteraceae bacterium]|nr:hypothetical protein [Solirubrobacteraceae bacterium]
MTWTPLSAEATAFRRRIVDALDRFEYVDRDNCAGACPACDGILSVHFAGTAARADLVCHSGCSEADVAAAIRKRARR